ncbi:putative DNA (cytosine-5-)-methyltransferase [Treponema phagedenis]|uniref:DNA (cytosine-5-)-methyltransferase n=1 Tax=Treponema phagedenis TaxID=162 RepID=A0A0B7GPN2_TREPH|nr:putative DNA (cytosine-5-)-methyltransferase [Treponema phagedenis]
MTYLSVCSGIEAATVAWEPLGFKPVAFAEVEEFPCEVLKQRFPQVPNWGDITKYEEWENEAVDIVVGGTPCQSFSIAGKRGGTNDLRGQLMYCYLEIVGKYKPKWVVWENVPGVLSSGNGLDFASFLAGLENSGMGGRTGCLTLNISERPKDAVESSLSDILIIGQTLPQKYYLSQKNLELLLKRAKIRERNYRNAYDRLWSKSL